MFKKITLLLMLSFSMVLHAGGLKDPVIVVDTFDKDAINMWGPNEIAVSVSLSAYKANKPWIGIYKVGTSTEWKNVQAWIWVPKEFNDFYIIDISDLTPGEYEARLFYNNSYKMEAKSTFTIEPSNIKPFIKLDKTIGNSSIDVSHSVGPKAWIGIYPVGSSTAWSNVKSWKWAEKDGTTTIPVAFLERAKYEARLFYNNSYVVEDKFTFGPVGGGPAGGRSPIRDINHHHHTHITERKVIFDTYGATPEKPWVGVYKKGAPINKQNLLAKGVLEQDNEKSWTYFKEVNNHFLVWGEYDMVYHPTSNFIYVGERKTLSLAPGADF